MSWISTPWSREGMCIFCEQPLSFLLSFIPKLACRSWICLQILFSSFYIVYICLILTSEEHGQDIVCIDTCIWLVQDCIWSIIKYWVTIDHTCMLIYVYKHVYICNASRIIHYAIYYSYVKTHFTFQVYLHITCIIAYCFI